MTASLYPQKGKITAAAAALVGAGAGIRGEIAAEMNCIDCRGDYPPPVEPQAGLVYGLGNVLTTAIVSADATVRLDGPARSSADAEMQVDGMDPVPFWGPAADPRGRLTPYRLAFAPQAAPGRYRLKIFDTHPAVASAAPRIGGLVSSMGRALLGHAIRPGLFPGLRAQPTGVPLGWSVDTRGTLIEQELEPTHPPPPLLPLELVGSLAGNLKLGHGIQFNGVLGSNILVSNNVKRPGTYLITEGGQLGLVPDEAARVVDDLNRMKVQFHWEEPKEATHWIRVVTPWAGKQWGMITIPRIGHEVIVDFVEGDPDQPFITGQVYGAEQMPPSKTPGDEKGTQDIKLTMTTVKTTPKLMMHCAMGDPVKDSLQPGGKLKIEFKKTTHEKEKYLHYEFENVFVSSYQTGGGAGDVIPMDSISINFAKVEVEYKEQNPKTGETKTRRFGWGLTPEGWQRIGRAAAQGAQFAGWSGVVHLGKLARMPDGRVMSAAGRPYEVNGRAAHYIVDKQLAAREGAIDRLADDSAIHPKPVRHILLQQTTHQILETERASAEVALGLEPGSLVTGERWTREGAWEQLDQAWYVGGVTSPKAREKLVGRAMNVIDDVATVGTSKLKLLSTGSIIEPAPETA